jgi:hypothetical protein
MPHHPLVASGTHDVKRAQPIPAKVKAAIALMVCGREDDEECKPVDRVEAAKLVGIEPYVLRRQLDKPHVRAYLIVQRRSFRDAVCASNELALKRVRDRSSNGMVTVAAVRALEQLDVENTPRSGADNNRPGVTIRLVNLAPQPAPLIDVTPSALVEPAVPDDR